VDPYIFCLSLGGAGLGVMGLSGIASAAHGAHGHGHHGHGQHGHGQHGHGHDVAHHGHAGHGHGVAHHGHAAHHDVAHPHHGDNPHHDPLGHHGAHHAPGGLMGRAFWALASPRTVFSVLLGLGATGTILRGPLGGGLVLFAVALLGGVALERLLVTPLWRFFERFASTPALGLESAIADEAKAASSFDARGQGLVAVELDGQIVQCLGTLTSEERAAGVRVRAGDRLRIEDVDAARNRCVVSTRR
jgi:hypothetical protein